jgi:hypothetical protein
MRRLAIIRHNTVSEGAILEESWASDRSKTQGALDINVGYDAESIGTDAIGLQTHTLRLIPKEDYQAGLYELGMGFGEREAPLVSLVPN